MYMDLEIGRERISYIQHVQTIRGGESVQYKYQSGKG